MFKELMKSFGFFVFCLFIGQSAIADDSLVGAWSGRVEITDPAGVPGFPTVISFHKGGTLTETHPFFSVDRVGLGNLMATPGHGQWEKVGPNYYKASFQLYIQGGPGNENYAGEMIGTNHINYFIHVADDGQSMQAKWSSRFIAPDGTQVMGGMGTFEGDRINVEPLP